jgi:hypothetical protein
MQEQTCKFILYLNCANPLNMAEGRRITAVTVQSVRNCFFMIFICYYSRTTLSYSYKT